MLQSLRKLQASMSDSLETQLEDEKLKCSALQEELDNERSRRIAAEESLRALQRKQGLIHQQVEMEEEQLVNKVFFFLFFRHYNIFHLC